MTITYDDVITKAQSNECSIKEFQDIMWQYVKETMTRILKSNGINLNLVKTLINYPGNTYGAHAMLLDMAPIKNVYENVSWFIFCYADAHEDSYKGTHYSDRFESNMNTYIYGEITKKIIENEIRDNPLIENLYKNGHNAFANKAIRLFIKEDERVKNANKLQKDALYEMRAYDFFKILEKVVVELGE